MMTHVVIRDFDGFVHLRDFIRERAEIGLSRFEKPGRPLQVHIIVGRDSLKSGPHNARFYCEVAVRRPGIKPVVTRVLSADFHHAVRDSMHKAEQVLKRNIEVRRAMRRVDSGVELQPPSVSSFERAG